MIVYAEVGGIDRFLRVKLLPVIAVCFPRCAPPPAAWITHLGSKPLRHALLEAAIIAIRKLPSLNRMDTRVLYRSNVQKARVAVAHKLALIIYAMLKNREPFRMETR